MKINCKLREILKQRGLSQTVFSQQSGVHPATVSRFANNAFHQIDVNSALKIIEFLNLETLNDLFEVVRDDAS